VTVLERNRHSPVEPGGEIKLTYAGAGTAMRARLLTLVEKPGFQRFILAVIVLNAITLGLETWPPAMRAAGGIIVAIDRIALAIFTIEVTMRLVAHGPRFFRDPWSVFDFSVVAIALIPASGGFAVLRALRVPQMAAVR
jgi:voltage-gated sodium channel